MCLGIPGRVVSVDDSAFLRMGRVDFGGITREVCLAYVPEARVGDYVIVHAGFAISQLSADEAAETLDLLSQVGLVDPVELKQPGPAPAPLPAQPAG